MRLGGELEPADGKVSRLKAQDVFFETLNEVAPKVFQDLQSLPLRAFMNAELHKQPFQIQHQVYKLLECGAHRLIDPRAVTVYFSLLKWAKKHHIEAQWCLERAYFSLVDWQQCPPEERTWTLGIGGNYVSSLPPDPPSGLVSYHPRFETRAGYLDYVAAEVKRQIDMNAVLSLAHDKARAGFITAIVRSKAMVDYCRDVEKCARLDGCKEPPVKPQLLEHMKWTVRVRVLGHSWEALSEELGLDPRTIQKAVRNTLLLLGLPHAPTFKEGKGRPPGKSDVKERHVARP